MHQEVDLQESETKGGGQWGSGKEEGSVLQMGHPRNSKQIKNKT